MKAVNRVLLLAALLALLSPAVHAGSALVYEWNYAWDAVWRVHLIEMDEGSGLITRVRTFRYQPESMPVPTEVLLAEGELLAETQLLESTAESMLYHQRSEEGVRQLRISLGERVVRINQGARRSEFSYHIDAPAPRVTYMRDEEAFAELQFHDRQIVYENQVGRQIFAVDRWGHYFRSEWHAGGGHGRIAGLSLEPNGSYLIETPNSGEPVPFLSRHEVWIDPVPVTDLRIAVINGFLLPSGNFSYIFPYFAPTPRDARAWAEARAE